MTATVTDESAVLRDNALKEAAKKAGEDAARFAMSQLRQSVVQAAGEGAAYGTFKVNSTTEANWFKSVMVAQFNRVMQGSLEEF